MEKRFIFYSVLPQHQGGQGDQGNKPTVTKTSETMTILGHPCTKYIVQMTEGSRTINQNLWATTDIKDIDIKNMRKQNFGRGHSIFYDGMDGFPLRIESSMPQGNMVMEVTDISRGSLQASDFTIPSDFKETQGMYGR
jgi:Domain of unknown function (DUF4412)